MISILLASAYWMSSISVHTNAGYNAIPSKMVVYYSTAVVAEIDECTIITNSYETVISPDLSWACDPIDKPAHKHVFFDDYVKGTANNRERKFRHHSNYWNPKGTDED